LARAKLDDNEPLRVWCETLERVIIETVESGKMTKDLAICVEGSMQVSRDKYLNTFEFMDAIADNLNAALGK
jgi:isocitrate dehydrogenase